MLRLLAPAFALVFVAAVAACPPSKPAGEGEGEGEGAHVGEGEGEGTAGEGEGVAGEGEGSAGEGEGEGAAQGCSVDADCNGGNGQSCQTIFSGAGTHDCFATCTDTTQPCTTLAGHTGDCENFDPNGQRPRICVEQAADRAPCGDKANAACGDNTAGHEAVCVTLGDDPNTPQDEHNFSFCLVGCASDADCVIAGETCSQDIHFTVGGGALLGTCAPTTSGGEACGVSADGATLCTGTEKCTIPSGQNAGTCQ